MFDRGHKDRTASKQSFWLRRVVRALLIYVLVPYLAVILIFAVFQRRLLYQPTVAENLTLMNVGLDSGDGLDIRIDAEEGVTLCGWLLYSQPLTKASKSQSPLVLYFPGNSLNRFNRLSDLRELTSQGFDVLIMDYRGYGDSAGSPSETNLTRDAKLIWQYAIQELGYREEQVVVFGESLGGAVALSLWSGKPKNFPEPAAMILNSTFDSLPATVADHYPWFPFQYLLLDRWPSENRIRFVEVPIIQFHGTDDQMIPLERGLRLSKSAEDVKWIEILGGMHNEIPTLKLNEELKIVKESLAITEQTTE